MNYDELVKDLRYCGDAGKSCLQCKFRDNYCFQTLAIQAADAIEELSELADAIPHVCECCIGCELEKKNGGCDHGFVLSPKRAMQYLIKPRWISVKDALPEEQQDVLVYLKRGGCAVDYFIPSRNNKWGYRDVTHWQTLPTPPKEDEA